MKLSVIYDFPARSFKWFVGLETLERSFDAQQDFLVELRDGSMSVV